MTLKLMGIKPKRRTLQALQSLSPISSYFSGRGVVFICCDTEEQPIIKSAIIVIRIFLMTIDEVSHILSWYLEIFFHVRELVNSFENYFQPHFDI